MKHTLIAIVVLTILAAPAALAQAPAGPEVPPMEAAVELPDAATSGTAAPVDLPSCLPEQQPLEQAGTCEDQCYEEYAQCVIFCSKNPCLVACETVLEICLGNCHSTS